MPKEYLFSYSTLVYNRLVWSNYVVCFNFWFIFCLHLYFVHVFNKQCLFYLYLKQTEVLCLLPLYFVLVSDKEYLFWHPTIVWKRLLETNKYLVRRLLSFVYLCILFLCPTVFLLYCLVWHFRSLELIYYSALNLFGHHNSILWAAEYEINLILFLRV